ncbi:MAG: hypothetical protein IPJ00_20740 [Saprospirales bacterium]|nr:hypothetical protein [Saprospirales bacterium]
MQTESVEIQVIPSPNPEIALLGETSICEGESVTLQADGSATQIAWYLDGELLEGDQPQIDAQEGGTYYAILSNEVCTIQTDAVEIEVIPYPSPEIALEGESSICEGESVLLSVDASAADIAWYLDGELLGWDQPQLEAQEGGAYYAVLSNQGCTVQTASVEIQVIPSPSPEITLTGETSLCEGESALLDVDNSALSIEWYLDGELLPWDQSQYEAKEGGTYYAILSNEVCTIQTESIEIQVQTPPDPTLIYEGTLACEGDSIPIIANNALDSWQWYLDGVPIESANGPHYWAGSSGVYSYTGTLGPCEISSEYVSISIVEAIVPTLSFLNDTLFAPRQRPINGTSMANCWKGPPAPSSCPSRAANTRSGPSTKTAAKPFPSPSR